MPTKLADPKIWGGRCLRQAQGAVVQIGPRQPIRRFLVARGRSQQCKAKAKSTGRRCENPVTPGYAVCRFHGANPKNKGGNPNIAEHNKRHSAKIKKQAAERRAQIKTWRDKLFTDRERQDYDEWWGKFTETHPELIGQPAAEAQLEELCYHLAKRAAAQRSGIEGGFKTHAARVSTLLAELGLRMDKKVNEQNHTGASLVALITGLSAEAKSLRERQGASRALPAGTIDVQVVETEKIPSKTAGDVE